MSRVGNRLRQRIIEYQPRLVEADAVLRKVRGSFFGIPFESQLHKQTWSEPRAAELRAISRLFWGLGHPTGRDFFDLDSGSMWQFLNR